MGNEMPTFRLRFKELRKRAGYRSQDAFADAFGVSLDTVRNWEQGKTIPRMEDCLRLSEFFDCDLDYLFGRIGQKHHDLAFVCDYTGLSAEAINNLASIENRRVGNDDLRVASELIASQHFYSLTRAILDLNWALEEAQEDLKTYAAYRESFLETGGLSDLQYKLRNLKALRYEVTEAVLRVVDDRAELDSTLREGERYVEAETIREREAKRNDY